MRRKNIQINKIRNEQGKLSQIPVKSRGSLENTSKPIFKKIGNLEDMDNFLDT
jgi:hypothetical protein